LTTGGITIVVFVLLGIFLIYQIGSHQNSSLDSTQSSTPSPVVANVGGTITIDNISCTLISANTNIAPGYVTVQMKLTNNSGKEYTIYGSDFVVKNSSGLIINSDAPGEAKLAPGGSAEFHLDFQVDGTHNAELFWQPTDLELYNDLTHYWNLGL